MIPIPDYTPDEISKFINGLLWIFAILIILLTINLILKIVINLHVLVVNYKKYILQRGTVYAEFTNQDASGV